MKRLPVQVGDLLDALARDLPPLLRHNLIGVYLFGSLARGGFDPQLSDIDVLVVTRRNLSAREFARLEKWAAELVAGSPKAGRWLERLELSCVRQASLLSDDPRACQLKHGRLTRCGWDAHAIVLLSASDGGAALYGPPPSAVLPPVTPGLLHATLRREAEYLREVLDGPPGGRREWPCYRAYAVLTACRILYTQATGRIGSKRASARWAQRRLKPFGPLIDLALANRAPDAAGRLPLRAVRALVAECTRQLDCRLPL